MSGEFNFGYVRVEAVVIHAAYERVIGQRAPPEPDMTVARYVTLVAGLAGFRPTKRQPLPGTRKLWQGLRILNVAETHARAIRACHYRILD